jgi:hypothetical protein
VEPVDAATAANDVVSESKAAVAAVSVRIFMIVSSSN